MRVFKGFKFQKKYTLFLAVVPLLLATSLYNVNCPVCDGQGVIQSQPVMENVKILDYSTRAVQTTPDACGLYLLYKYDVPISLLNESSDDAQGWLKMVLRDTFTDNIVDEQYVAVEMAGLTTLDTKYTVWFGSAVGVNSGIIETSGQLEVDVEVVVGDVPDLVCNGTGKVPLNTVFFVNGLSDTFADIVRTEQTYNPPKEVDWADFIDPG
jgi:hypothetical protein